MPDRLTHLPDETAPAAQSYLERPPLPALRGVVSSVWIQNVAADAEPYTQRNIPSGSVEVVWRVGTTPQVVGPLTKPLVEVLAPGTTIVGVRFRPGAASPILALPACELVDLALDGSELWGDSVHALVERVGDDGRPADVLNALQSHLVGVMADARPPDRLVNEIVRSLRWRTQDVLSLTSTLHISERTLRRRCQDAVGLAPKTLHRMLRFNEFLALAQHAIAEGRAPTDEGLARLALEAGYADQSHLTRECLRLTGASPGSFLGEAEAVCGCGHDHRASFMPVLQSRPRPSR